MQNRKPARRFNKRTLLICLAVLVALLVVAGLLYRHNHKPAQISTIPIQSSSDTVKTNNSSGNASSQPTNNTNSSSNKTPVAGSTTPSTKLTAPSGTFVSNHRPSLSGANGVPSTEQSVCNTSPGATCTISFTMGNVTKNLDAQTADATGTVYWNWDVKQAGFTTGSWKITATASLNGTAQSASDGLALEVQP